MDDRITSASPVPRRLHQVEIELDVPFHDVDILGVVWHGHYYKYLELGRTELMRQRGLDVPEIAACGFRQVVVESRCRHTYPLRYGERARVSAWLSALTPRIMIHYRVRNVTAGRCSARAQTTLVTTAPDGTLLMETPDVLLAKLRP
ncbi:MAG: acyl-CoA thioesterase [Myxococcales bacterium]|nr:acyl-CoA thioesterase [Myxococcales bacterium]